MLAVARTLTLIGVEAEPVHVELDVASGLPAFAIVGLPGAAVRESRERVRAAFTNSGFDFPLRRITANLAPADLPKAGPGFDLAIAAALLAASGQMPAHALDRHPLAGELALDGSIRPVAGALAMAERARRWGMRGVVVAPEDAREAALVDGLEVLCLDHLAKLPELGEGGLPGPPEGGSARVVTEDLPDLADLRGQPVLRRNLEIAAAGGHSMLMLGPPGAGKTLAARRLPSLLPPLPEDEALEVARIASVCGNGHDPGTYGRRPYRAPHHTISAAALIGGGRPPHPGEITRAHRGVLFLDELGEFRRDALEALREPLEAGRVTIARGGRAVEMPCRFMLVAASNPCPCGRGPDSGECSCNPQAVSRYRGKLSGALSDRIDTVIWLERPSADALAAAEPEEGSAAARARVIAARERQAQRLGADRCNAEMTAAEVSRHCALDGAGEGMLRDGHERLALSGRGWDRSLRVARTIADLAGSASIEEDHVAQALNARRPREEL
ncbi:MAG: ATP-binding protein [Solirubrobacterales bacterium]|nr:ATP-binding protein [Solirubrobacterales bacterium]